MENPKVTDVLQGPHFVALRTITFNNKSTFLTSGHSICFTIFPQIHSFMHTFTHDGGVNQVRWQPASREQSGWGVLLRDTSTLLLGGAGDETSNLPVTSQPGLPPGHIPPLQPRWWLIVAWWTCVHKWCLSLQLVTASLPWNNPHTHLYMNLKGGSILEPNSDFLAFLSVI